MSGIYIHIPFCKQACHYCDFHFSTLMGKKGAMVSALQKELTVRKDEFEKKVVETIYFGGGTPSILTSGEIDRLLETVYKNYKISDNPEVTLEANPDDLSKNRIVELSHSPVNRLSIGIQSFFEEDLRLMNRAHSANEAMTSLSEATKHFDNISIDLIYGIPGMSNDRWLQNIQKALSFDVPHISGYALTVEPKTALAHMIKKGRISGIDDILAEQQFHMLVDILEEKGFVNYEISNFGKEGFFSRNNTAYWLGKHYLGIGPSAHSYNGKQRAWNINSNPKYIKALQNNELPMEVETLSVRDRYNEYIMTGLRTIWGVSLQSVASGFGKEYTEHLMQKMNVPIERKFLVLEDNTLKVTKKGKFLVDGLAADLFVLNLR